MPNTAITMLNLTRNGQKEFTTTAATADTADLAEVFDITPTADDKMYIQINNVSGTNGSVTWSLAAGDFPMAVGALTGTIPQGKSYLIQVETGRYKKNTGKLALTITPASGKKLKTDHTLTVQSVQLG